MIHENVKVVQVLLFAQDYTRFLLETLRTIVHKGGGKGCLQFWSTKARSIIEVKMTSQEG